MSTPSTTAIKTKSRLIVIDASSPDIASDMSFESEIRGKKMIDISLLSISIPNVEYNIRKGEGDKIPFERDGKKYVAIIAPGQWDSFSLPAEIQVVMNKADEGGKYTAGYDAAAKKLFVAAEKQFSFNWKNVPEAESARSFLGFKKERELTKVHKGERCPNFWEWSRPYIIVDFMEGQHVIDTCLFPIVLDPKEEVTTRSYNGFSKELKGTIPSSVNVYLARHSGARLKETGFWNVNMNVRYEDDEAKAKEEPSGKAREKIVEVSPEKGREEITQRVVREKIVEQSPPKASREEITQTAIREKTAEAPSEKAREQLPSRQIKEDPTPRTASMESVPREDVTPKSSRGGIVEQPSQRMIREQPSWRPKLIEQPPLRVTRGGPAEQHLERSREDYSSGAMRRRTVDESSLRVSSREFFPRDTREKIVEQPPLKVSREEFSLRAAREKMLGSNERSSMIVSKTEKNWGPAIHTSERDMYREGNYWQ